MIALAMTVLLAAEPVAKGSGERLCVLTAADFRASGIAVNAKPSINLDDGGKSAYCVYRGKSGATGGVELDVFYPAGESAADLGNTWKAMLASSPGAKWEPEGLPGVDDSVYSLAIPQSGYPNYAANGVRRGELIFAISLPAAPGAKDELRKLSALVLARLAR